MRMLKGKLGLKVMSALVASIFFVSLLPIGTFKVAAAGGGSDTYTVTVTDSSTTNPIQGATVTVTNTTDTNDTDTGITDSSGNASWSDLTEGANYNFTVTCSGYVTETGTFTAITNNGSGSVSLTAGTPPSITTTSLQNGTVNASYSQTLVANGNPSTFVWSVKSGNLPDGVSLASDGKISGTPTVAGDFNFTIQADNGISSPATKVLSIHVDKIATSLTLTADPSTGVNNSNVTLTAQITPAISGANIVFDYVSGTATVQTDAQGKATATFIADITKTYSSITATYAGDSIYSNSTASISNYAVNKAEQDFSLADGTSVTKTYSSATYKNNVTDIVGDGTYSYNSTNSNVATVDLSGNVNFVGVGQTSIQVIREATTGYNQKEIDYTLTVDKATLSFNTNPAMVSKAYDGTNKVKISGGTLSGILNNDDVSVDYINSNCTIDSKDAGISHFVSSNCVLTGAKAGNYTLTQPTSLGNVTISPKDLIVTASINNKQYDDLPDATFVTIPALNGVVASEDVTLNNGTPSFDSVNPTTGIHVTTNFTLTGTAKLSNYNLIQPSNLTADITQNFAATKDTEYTTNSPDGSNEWYKSSDFIISAKSGYKLSLNNTDAGPWSDTLSPYTIETPSGLAIFYVRNMANKQISEQVTENYKIDRTAPDNLKITYSTSVLDKVLNTITFGFYKAPVTVTVSANDATSGVQKIDYTYALDSGVSDINHGGSGTLTTLTKNNNTYTGTFNIDPQFRGKVSITATDSAGNSSTFNDTKVVVVDNITPNVTVTYNAPAQTASNGKNFYNNVPTSIDYYNGDITATIKVTEANFFADQVALSVGCNGSTNSYTTVSDWTQSGDDWIKVIKLSGEGDYSIGINYTDYSGNAASYVKNNIVMDKTSPAISVIYDTQPASISGDIYNEARTATVTINEHNFRVSDVNIVTTQTDINGTNNEVSQPTISNWNDNGDRHTATITYTNGNYTFDISYKDLALNQNTTVDYGSSVDPKNFVVDTTAPKNLKINYSTSVLDAVLESLTFGFYKAPVTVTVSADDTTTGVKQINYTYGVDAGKSTRNQGGNGTLNTLTKNGLTYTGSFQIPAQFRGKVSITAVDKASNQAMMNDTKVVVVDDISPTATVSYNTPVQTKDGIDYYNGSVTAAIEINEANFWPSDVNLTVTKDGVNFTPFVVSDWAQQPGSDINQKTIKLTDDGHYAITIAYTDKSSNQLVTYTKNNIVIDATAPAITVDWTQPSRSYNNVDYYNKDAAATITVSDTNFFAVDPVITATKDSAAATPQTVSDWTQVSGTNQWKKVVKFSGEGNYALKVDYKDRSGNVMPTYTKNNITIDTTKSVISVSYDNNSAQNGNYYRANRTATIQVIEHNFKADEVVVTQTAKLNGANIAKPAVSAWTNNGDRHTATITYSNDGQYTLDVSYTDLATNTANPLQQQVFYIDKTVPVVPTKLPDIGVSQINGSKSIVTPHITISDNYYDPNKVKISLTGSKNGMLTLNGSWLQNTDGRGGTFVFQNFPDNKATDDVYTITVTTTDKAGNQTTSVPLTFSVNRYGSTFDLTKVNDIKNAYTKTVNDIVFTEINPTTIATDSYMLTLSQNGNIRQLIEGTDYMRTMSARYGTWTEYTYTVKANDFKGDGLYVLSLKDKDNANNKNSSDDPKQGGYNLSFSIDNTKPTAVVSGIANDQIYSSNKQTAIIAISDNIKLKSYSVTLNGKDVTKECTGTSDNLSNVKLSLDIPANFNRQNLVIDCVDEAGNPSSTKISNFLVNSNMFVQYYQSKPLFYGSLGGVAIIIISLSAFFIFRGRKQELSESN